MHFPKFCPPTSIFLILRNNAIYFHIKETKVLQPEFSSSQNVTHDKIFHGHNLFFLDIRHECALFYLPIKLEFALFYKYDSSESYEICTKLSDLRSRVEI